MRRFTGVGGHGCGEAHHKLILEKEAGKIVIPTAVEQPWRLQILSLGSLIGGIIEAINSSILQGEVHTSTVVQRCIVRTEIGSDRLIVEIELPVILLSCPDGAYRSCVCLLLTWCVTPQIYVSKTLQVGYDLEFSLGVHRSRAGEQIWMSIQQLPWICGRRTNETGNAKPMWLTLLNPTSKVLQTRFSSSLLLHPFCSICLRA